jgi:hypothetical protein
MTGLADQTYILAAVGDPGSTNISNAEVVEMAAFGDNEVYRRTGKSSFDTNADDYQSARMAANLFAISMAKRKFPDLAGTANTDFNIAVELTNSITTDDTDVDVDTGTPLMVVGDYSTQPANPNAPYTFATRNRGSISRTLRDVMTDFI